MNLSRLSFVAAGVSLALAGSGCVQFDTQAAPNPAHVLDGSKRPRKLFVFFDGTSNDWKTRTNVRRMFELVAAQEDPRRLCFWVEGVGTKNRGPGWVTLLGQGLGYGLKDRVETAYEFLARNYRPAGGGREKADEIYVFGFSRGAWQARTLCGMLAYAGLHPVDAQGHVPADQIFEAVSELPEEQWPTLSPAEQEKRNHDQMVVNRQTMLARFPRLQQGVKVKFLGIWDTVAGFQVTKIDADGEQTKRVKGLLTPRYKVRPYENIEQVAHALAIDEVRSQFRPTRVGPPLNSATTKVYETWFPGVHSDVGGGYDDSNGLAGVSLNWMLELLGRDELIPGKYKVAEDPLGLMHHSEVGFGAFGSHPVPRVLPYNASVHESFWKRIAANSVWETFPNRAVNPVETRYRPDVPVQVTWANGNRGPLEQPFVKAPAEATAGTLAAENASTDSPEMRRFAEFDTKKFDKKFKKTKTADAKQHKVTGNPLSVEATVVPDAKQPTPEAASQVVAPKPVAPKPAVSAKPTKRTAQAGAPETATLSASGG